MSTKKSENRGNRLIAPMWGAKVREMKMDFYTGYENDILMPKEHQFYGAAYFNGMERIAGLYRTFWIGRKVSG